jgi:hypothetical protein
MSRTLDDRHDGDVAARAHEPAVEMGDRFVTNPFEPARAHVLDLELAEPKGGLYRRHNEPTDLLELEPHGEVAGIGDVLEIERERLKLRLLIDDKAQDARGLVQVERGIDRQRELAPTQVELIESMAPHGHSVYPRAIRADQARSNRPAAPWPPPMHIVTIAYLPPRRLSS